MKISEIEGLSFMELKARHGELLKILAGVDKDILALRYLKARTDATMRDEEMVRQSALVTEARESAAEQAQALGDEIATLKIEVMEKQAAGKVALQSIEALQARIAELEAQD